jgi:dihydroorotate dehydrogenase (NAD+) catalytic subunit
MEPVSFLGKSLKTPLALASGILGNNAGILERVHRAGCGLVTMKSIGPEPRDGHNNPTVIDLGGGMINAVGLPTPGYDHMDAEWQALADRTFPLNASIYGGSVEEFVKVAQYVSDKGPDFIEINISCPNSDRHGMLFGVDEKAAFAVTDAVKRVIAVPLIEARMPVLAFKKGGLSGPMIKPVAVRCVYDIYRAVSIPIIGLGGVTTGEDAVELFMAGAALVGMGSAVRYRGIDVFDQVNRELADWLTDHHTTRDEIIGAAHEVHEAFKACETPDVHDGRHTP